MLLERNVVGKKTDWANYITLADEHETPMLRRLPSKPVPSSGCQIRKSRPAGRARCRRKCWMTSSCVPMQAVKMRSIGRSFGCDGRELSL